MIFDGYVHQLPDTDPGETQEWLDSLDAVIEVHGKTRARYLLSTLLDRAREAQVSFPATVSTPYINTIPRESEPWFPGDEFIERRIRAFVRWNAAMMVVKANKAADGIGGHLSTYASSASLYEIGFNHFFRGKDDGNPGDQIYFQGHAAPGIYARAFIEGRLEPDDLDHFRREIGRNGRGLSSYPHPRLMPDFWEFPTVSMGLGPITALYQARYNRYLQARQLADTSQSRVWAFLGDGECDEPETLGALTLASREHLDNLIFVVNCNLQRLDGPVRGNGKIIQELEAVFRGAGWNVIKVILGSKWDELLAADKDGVLLNKLNTTVDGEFQRYSTETGDYIRDHFFGPDPRLREMVAHLSDQDLVNLPRGGHDYRKLYAAYKAATENLGSGAPTALLCKTIKGWTLGPDIEGRNATHQIKKMNKEQLLRLRDRLYLHEEIPESALDGDSAPYFRPSQDSIEYQYMMERRRALGGSLPKRVVRYRRPVALPDDNAFAELRKGSGGQAVSTTMGFTRLLRNVARDANFGKHVVPIIPDEGRTFGMDSLFPQLKIYASQGQLYEPVDHDLLLSYAESKTGQILEEGITETGSTASFIAAGTAYATHATPTVPFYTFYSMFGFQRVGDLIWQAADARDTGLPARCHRGTHDAARRGSAAPGRALAGARFDGAGVPGVRPGVRLRGGDDRATGPGADVRGRRSGRCFPRRLLLPHPVQRELPDAADARACAAERRDRAGCTAGRSAPRAPVGRRRCCSPAPPRAPRARRRRSWQRTGTSASSCGRRRRTRRSARRRCGPSGGTACTRASSRAYRSSPSCSAVLRHRSSPSPTS